MIDKRMLVDSLEVRLEIGKDEWGSPKYGESFNLNPVRFDRSLATKGVKNNREHTKPGVIYVYPEHCDVKVDNSWINAEVKDEFGTYYIKDVFPNKHPFTNMFFSYEIEVI